MSDSTATNLPSVDLAAGIHELPGFLLHAHRQRSGFVDFLLGSVLTYVLGDFHGTEMWTTHRTEVRELCAFLRQRLIVILTRDVAAGRRKARSEEHTSEL